MTSSKRILVALVRHKPGVLARIATLFRRRGFNIDSLAVGPAEQSGMARMTFVVEGKRHAVTKAAIQLGRLVDVVEVQDITDRSFVWRELVLIKVKLTAETRSEILETGKIFGAKVVDIGVGALTFETAGGRTKSTALIALLRKFGLLEVMRTGRVATLRSAIDDSASDGDFLENDEEAPETEYGHGSV